MGEWCRTILLPWCEDSTSRPCRKKNNPLSCLFQGLCHSHTALSFAYSTVQPAQTRRFFVLLGAMPHSSYLKSVNELSRQAKSNSVMNCVILVNRFVGLHCASLLNKAVIVLISVLIIVLREVTSSHETFLTLVHGLWSYVGTTFPPLSLNVQIMCHDSFMIPH